MNLRTQLKRIQRFLRDPDNNIWDRDLLINLYNDSQKDLQHSTKYVKDIQVLGLPAYYQSSYFYDWEYPYLIGTKTYQALGYYIDYVVCNSWEPAIIYGDGGTFSEWGAHFTQPFEAFMGLNPGAVVKTSLPSNYHTAQFIAYDRKPIDYLSKKDITNTDSSYINRQGDPIGYYREDELSNEFILYPRPSTIVWNEQDTYLFDPDSVYAHDWESDYAEEQFLRTDSANERQYAFLWEDDLGADSDYGLRGCFLFELGQVPSGETGTVLYVEGDTTNTPVGTYIDRTKNLFNQETGITISTIDDDDNILLVYDVNPTDLSDDREESDFPKFLRKYIEYNVISRAYGANTDGRIKSLSDYWSYRSLIGKEMIKRFKIKRTQDRDYRLTTSTLPGRRTQRHPRLPSTYPAVG